MCGFPVHKQNSKTLDSCSNFCKKMHFRTMVFSNTQSLNLSGKFGVCTSKWIRREAERKSVSWCNFRVRFLGVTQLIQPRICACVPVWWLSSLTQSSHLCRWFCCVLQRDLRMPSPRPTESNSKTLDLRSLVLGLQSTANGASR